MQIENWTLKWKTKQQQKNNNSMHILYDFFLQSNKII